jgi:hypothetical protein
MIDFKEWFGRSRFAIVDTEADVRRKFEAVVIGCVSSAVDVTCEGLRSGDANVNDLVGGYEIEPMRSAGEMKDFAAIGLSTSSLPADGVSPMRDSNISISVLCL